MGRMGNGRILPFCSLITEQKALSTFGMRYSKANSMLLMEFTNSNSKLQTMCRRTLQGVGRQEEIENN